MYKKKHTHTNKQTQENDGFFWAACLSLENYGNKSGND
jgi:hypothetical protein